LSIDYQTVGTKGEVSKFYSKASAPEALLAEPGFTPRVIPGYCRQKYKTGAYVYSFYMGGLEAFGLKEANFL
jgi:hypothetical protein